MNQKIVIKDNKEYIITDTGRMFYPKRIVKFFSEKRACWISYERPAREANYSIGANGYMRASRWLVHRAVAFGFLGTPKNPKFTVNHKDGNKLNNNVENLEWVSHSNNCRHYTTSDMAIGKKLHPIEVSTKEGKYVGVYRSKTSAANDLGLFKSAITMCFTGRLHTHGGYTFNSITKDEYYEKRELQEA
jgi:hypothetical protein